MNRYTINKKRVYADVLSGLESNPDSTVCVTGTPRGEPPYSNSSKEFTGESFVKELSMWVESLDENQVIIVSEGGRNAQQSRTV